MNYEELREKKKGKYKPCECCQTNQVRDIGKVKYCKNCANFLNVERTRQYNQIRARVHKDFEKYLKQAEYWAKRLRACYLQHYVDLDHKDCLELAEVFEGDLNGNIWD